MSMDDPFGGLAQTNETPKKDTMSTTKTDAVDSDAANDAIKYFLSELSLGEEDYEEPEPYAPYIQPAERTWVALEITGAKLETREARVVVAYDKNGERAIDPKKIEEIVAAGGEEEVEEGVSYYQFRLEAQHLGTHFGKRNSPYLLFIPVFPMKVAFKEPRKNRNTGEFELGFVKEAGRKLLAATRVGIGRTITEDEDVLNEAAEALIGKRIMVQVNRRESKQTGSKPRLHADGVTFVKAKVDETTGSFVTLVKNGDGYVDKNSGEAYEGPTAGLIPVKPGEGNTEFLIPDSSDFGQVVRDTTETSRVFDNLYDDTFRVPNVVMAAKQVTKDIAARFEVTDRLDGKKEVSRYVEIVRNDGSEVVGQLTWETVGFVATATKTPGTAIQATFAGGELVTATWLGTHWQETPQQHQVVVSEDGKPRIAPVAVASAAESSGLDVFKGDATG